MRKQFKGRKKEHRMSKMCKTQEVVVDLNLCTSVIILHIS